MPANRFRAVIFDLDGTLIYSLADVAAAVNRVLADAGLEAIEGEARYALLGEGARIRIRNAFGIRGATLTDAELDRRTRDFTGYYAEMRVRHTVAFAGATAILGRLSKSGVVCGVCTNKDEASARDILKKLQLMPPVSDVAGADTFGMQKPHPDHLLKLLKRMGIGPESAIMVGDSIHDVETARRAGVAVAAVTWGYSMQPASQLGADHVLQGFDDLVEIVLA